MSRVPPYLITGGRTRPTCEVAIETLVEALPHAASSIDARFETRSLLDLATRPISVAEIAAELQLPLGATLVLVSDLLESGTLVGHQTTAQSELSNREIMTRIIHRVQEL